jgi:hypothetical protein
MVLSYPKMIQFYSQKKTLYIGKICMYPSCSFYSKEEIQLNSSLASPYDGFPTIFHKFERSFCTHIYQDAMTNELWLSCKTEIGKLFHVMILI